jgi:basic membrane protein A
VKESKSEADYVPNLTYFCDNDFDVIIAIGFLMAPTVGQLAPKCTNSKFAIVDNSVVGDPINAAPNVTGLLFKEQETGYLVGYLAGLVVKNNVKVNGAKAVSSVGGLKIPPVDRFIAGYQKGAKDADPGLKTLNGYSQDFVDQAKCKELALSQIEQGSGVVFQVAGGCGLGALEAAGEKNVWGIGVDADQSAVGPQVLTSAVKRVESAVFLAIKAAQDGSLQGGTDNTYGLAEDGVALGTVSPDVPQALVDEVNAKAEEIKSGSVTIPDTVAG